MEKIKIAFDVDGTLIELTGPKEDTPRYDVITVFKFLAQNPNHDMIIWSGGGQDYAYRWAEKLGLKARVIEKWSEEVDLAFDDSDIPMLAKVGVRV